MTDPIICWFRRDLRLGDNPALAKAAETGRPVIPVFILDDTVSQMGAAAKWRLGLSLADLAARLEGVGSRLILRRGRPVDVLGELAQQTGATQVHWSRMYDRQGIDLAAEVKSDLGDQGIEARSFNAHLLFEPWTVETGSGGPYKVYSPFWRAVKDRDVPAPLPAPSALAAPQDWPDSDNLDDWALGAEMRRGADVVAAHVTVGEEAAQGRLGAFIAHHADEYKARRDYPADPVPSGLSENLTYGEISPRTIWHAGQRAWHEGKAGAEHFLKELVWREFAYHLLYHFPDLDHKNWRDGWDDFPWRGDNDDAQAWRQGRTGEPFVDAAMREMYVTGRMHNRSRMIVASYLTKHLLVDWRVGLDWFAECLVDWDPASNAMGWQWVAGCGPDAAPYFRIYNPETQIEKFDPQHKYVDRWIAEGKANPSDDALSFFQAVPRSWSLSPKADYPSRIVGLKEGRERALAAYEQVKK